MLKVLVLIKQVPDTSSKAGVNADGTIDRARAKRMLNPFDRYALQKAIELKRDNNAEVICATMGPPNASEVLIDALDFGADRGIHLSDRRLAASDTLATAYALHMVAKYVGDVDILLTGLQTTDGDTAQVGPQIAERLDFSQITYCEELKFENGKVLASRVVEGGSQELESPTPLLVTMANSATPLGNKRFADVANVKELLRQPEERAKRIETVSLDDINADPTRTGLVGSPTVVGKTWKIGEIGGSCQKFEGSAINHEVDGLIKKLIEDKCQIEELL